VLLRAAWRGARRARLRLLSVVCARGREQQQQQRRRRKCREEHEARRTAAERTGAHAEWRSLC
jgi:hypothetical protein